MASSLSDTVEAERLPVEMSEVTELALSDVKIDEAKLLGRGAFSSVYEGTLTTAAGALPVAIKKMKIPAQLSRDSKYLWTELRVLS
jgi:hypothetical protein